MSALPTGSGFKYPCIFPPGRVTRTSSEVALPGVTDRMTPLYELISWPPLCEFAL
jgi:hypothetical protein